MSRKISAGISRALVAVLLCSAMPLVAQVPIVQPGAPGQPDRLLTAQEARALARLDFAPADVQFMQAMIVHHAQAVEMAALVEGRTSAEAVVAMAGRITASQQDEMRFMREWLQRYGQTAEMAGMGHADHSQMSGMASPQDMARLASLRSVAFDQLFLQLMIKHHQGALTMVEELLDQGGTAADPLMLRFTNDVVSDQEAEIERMTIALAGLSGDPRVQLAAGFLDAGEAVRNLRHVAFLPKPDGFFDPANPAELLPEVPPETGQAEAPSQPDAAPAGHAEHAHVPAAAPAAAASPAPEGETEAEKQFAERGSLLVFANTDMAFAGDVMVAGSYHGFNTYRLGSDGVPQLLGSVVCPGGQGDVSIAGNLLVMSVEEERGRVDCGLQGVREEVSAERFRGLRIFDISDITRPRQVGQVQTCRGSHTHSIVQQTATSLIVYNSGTAGVRDEEELAGCIDGDLGDPRTALFRIDIVEIPLADPASARIVSSPAVFADSASGRLGGLWRGGDHGDDTQETDVTKHCHDITVFPALQLAAGACSGNGLIFDIADPLNPVRIDEVTDPGFAYWHSATFNNDGTKVLFTDEWGGGGRPRCQASDPRTWGADAFYTIEDRQLVRQGTFKLPAPQGEMENCVAHNGSIIPVPGRDIFVQAWYQGGVSVIDFTDAANPVEIAYFDRGPINDEQLVVGGYWSAYWFNGRIYATEITRGIDVFALEPSEFLTAEEIAAAQAAQYEGGVFNPQTQTRVTWPAGVVERLEASRRRGG